MMILDFKKEIAFAKNVRVGVGGAPGFFVAVGQQDLRDVAAQASGHTDQPFGVLREQIPIDARLIVEPFEEAGGDQVDEVAIAFLSFAEEDQMVVAIGVAAGLVAL